MKYFVIDSPLLPPGRPKIALKIPGKAQLCNNTAVGPFSSIFWRGFYRMKLILFARHFFRTKNVGAILCEALKSATKTLCSDIYYY